MLPEGTSVKGSPEDKQPSGPCIKGSAKISWQVTLALYTGFKCVLQGALYFLHQVRIVRNLSNLLRVWTDRAAAAVARSHWNTFAAPHETSKLTPLPTFSSVMASVTMSQYISMGSNLTLTLLLGLFIA